MLVDSHCHLDKLNYTDLHTDVADVIAKAAARDVHYMLSVGVSLSAYPAMLELIRPFDKVFASCGIHPLDLDDGVDFALLKSYAQDDKVVAIGETGLDYYYSTDTKTAQQQAFAAQIGIAVELQKPLIVHTRMAREDTLALLNSEQANKIGGVLHCFTEDYAMAKAAIDLGFYISISGIASFNKATELKDVVRKLPLDRILVETDSPYLAPVPYRGKENQPAYVHEVARNVALLKGISFEEVCEATTNNFFNLFKKAPR